MAYDMKWRNDEINLLYLSAHRHRAMKAGNLCPQSSLRLRHCAVMQCVISKIFSYTYSNIFNQLEIIPHVYVVYYIQHIHYISNSIYLMVLLNTDSKPNLVRNQLESPLVLLQKVWYQFALSNLIECIVFNLACNWVVHCFYTGVTGSWGSVQHR